MRKWGGGGEMGGKTKREGKKEEARGKDITRVVQGDSSGVTP